MIERELGHGGMGQVWLGRDHRGGRYAIKTLRQDLATDRDVVRRFIREREVLLSLDHPGLVRIHDMVIEGQTMAIVMDLVEGGDLAELIGAGGPIAPAQVARMGAKMAGALAYAHEAGVVHRDLKPANILIDTSAGSKPEPRLADFGIAILASASGTTQTALIGTAQYLAPELFDDKQPTAAVDVYSLGFVLYEMLHGRAPFSGHSTARVMAMHAHALPGRPEGVPDPLWSLILDMVAKHPLARPSAGQVADRLEVMAPALRGIPPSPRPHATPAPVWPDDEHTALAPGRTTDTATAEDAVLHDALTQRVDRGDHDAGASPPPTNDPASPSRSSEAHAAVQKLDLPSERDEGEPRRRPAKMLVMAGGVVAAAAVSVVVVMALANGNTHPVIASGGDMLKLIADNQLAYRSSCSELTDGQGPHFWPWDAEPHVVRMSCDDPLTAMPATLVIASYESVEDARAAFEEYVSMHGSVSYAPIDITLEYHDGGVRGFERQAENEAVVIWSDESTMTLSRLHTYEGTASDLTAHWMEYPDYEL
ncbi:serine/threonine-protein kinase [Ornithinimicrobium cryptoxanthini]|uniref:non-specific serine/threonine protein kinase n=1 Tax=Ornithinimicrobium cryptoxanthini TaxID=2934161 RepID=A0ABY4YG85_9MICO|nr:serine/threonine-protein kinase [Ornithinimicrobium cryptoxanthini]USQ75363.1 serine/threonine protein kinase [Ornithinimicrobium cryptoxanthini]